MGEKEYSGWELIIKTEEERIAASRLGTKGSRRGPAKEKPTKEKNTVEKKAPRPRCFDVYDIECYKDEDGVQIPYAFGFTSAQGKDIKLHKTLCEVVTEEEKLPGERYYRYSLRVDEKD